MLKDLTTTPNGVVVTFLNLPPLINTEPVLCREIIDPVHRNPVNSDLTIRRSAGAPDRWIAKSTAQRYTKVSLPCNWISCARACHFDFF